ncbi:hypothetical protein ELE95_30255, partial [Klebsiella pneumoniae]|nr:hypothetical protein [Klebsiella pneumoniae]
PQYDFYYLVQQWAGSYCNTKEKCCFPKSGKPAGDAFTLHQIKPVVTKDGSSPSYCKSLSYDKTKVFDVMSSRLKYWPSLSCPSEFGNQFWSSVWNSYGTCTQMDQHS